jgi:transposase
MGKALPLQIVNPHAAGIDVGSRSHFVAIDQNRQNVRSFGIGTKDHQELMLHLRDAGITSVAMESTGTYWQTLFNALQKAGLEVLLVGGSQTKHVQGRKTDVLDCMWIQKLHSLGLLSGSFLLSDTLQELRTYYDHRQHLVEQISRYTHKMQKALRLMNVRLDVAIRDITGKSGLAIIEAILAGSRDPHHLASLVDVRMKRSKQQIAEALHGSWREELLFELRACLNFYRLYEEALKECDQVIERSLIKHAPQQAATEPEEKAVKLPKKKSSKNAPGFNVPELAYRYFKTDLFAIPGISYGTVLCLLTTMGNDLHRFPSGKSFASWLRLVPNNKVSGGRVISSRTRRGKSSLALALRQAANAIGNQKEHELTPFFRRIAFKKGRIAAITATARKLAVIIWNMVTKKEPYKKKEIKETNEKSRRTGLRQVERRIQALQLNQSELEKLFSRASFLAT